MSSFILSEGGDHILAESGDAIVAEDHVSSVTLSLNPSSGVASTSLALTAPTQIPLAAASGVASTSIVLAAGAGVVSLNPASGQASATLALKAPTSVLLGASSGVASATLALSVKALDVFLVGGQSNAQGRGDSSLSTVCPAGQGFEFYSGALHNIVDPVTGASTGSAWPAFCAEYFAATGRRAVIVAKGAAGSAQIVAADDGNGNWSSTGTLFGSATTAYDSAISTLQGLGYTVNVAGVLWSQGEREAQEIDLATVTKADYKAGLEDMIARFRTHYSAALPFYIFRTGVNQTGDTAGWAAVRAAQDEVAAADPLTWDVFTDAVNFPGEGFSNGLHYTQAGYNKMGHDGADAVAATVGALLLSVSSGSSSATLALTTPTRVQLNASSGAASALLALTAPSLLALTSSGEASAFLALSTPITIPLVPASGGALAVLSLAARTQVLFAPSFGLASASLHLLIMRPIPPGDTSAAGVGADTSASSEVGTNVISEDTHT